MLNNKLKTPKKRSTLKRYKFSNTVEAKKDKKV